MLFTTKEIVQDRRDDILRGIDFSANTDLLSKFMLTTNAQGLPKFNNKYPFQGGIRIPTIIDFFEISPGCVEKLFDCRERYH